MTRRSPPDARAFWVAYAILLPVFLLPLWLTPVLPALDAPFHLALADLLGKALEPTSPYDGFYAPRLLAPALPWLALAGLGRIVGGMTALRLLVASYVAVLPLAVACLGRRFGAPRVPALLALPLAYNMALHYGFLGYALSLPMVFGVLAWAADDLAAPTVATTTRLALASCILFLTHLESFVLALVAVAAMALVARRVRLRTALAFLPSLLLFAAWSGGRAPGLLAGMIAVRRAELGDRSVLADLGTRLVQVPQHLLRGFRDGSDRVMSVALLVCVTGLVVAYARGSRGALADRRRLVLPAVALVAYLALPHHLDAYEAMSVAPRLAPLFVLSLLTVVAGRRARFALPVVILVGLAHGVVVGRAYRAFGREVADFEEVMARVPAGGRLLGLVHDGESRVTNVESVMRGLPSLYVALRSSPHGMVALRYCGMRHVPCALGPGLVPAPNPWTPEALDPARATAFFDYALVRGGPNRARMFGDHPAELLAESGTWRAFAFPHPR